MAEGNYSAEEPEEPSSGPEDKADRGTEFPSGTAVDGKLREDSREQGWSEEKEQSQGKVEATILKAPADGAGHGSQEGGRSGSVRVERGRKDLLRIINQQ